MKDSVIPVAREIDLVIQELEDEVLVFDLKTNKAHCLNQTASTVWKFCDGKNTVSDINKLLEIETGAKIPENLIWLAIDQLNERELFEERFEARFAGQSRREILKKIGLVTVVSLPVVASITAPTAVMATACSGTVSNCTGCPNGTPCSTPTVPKGTCVTNACVANPPPFSPKS